LHERRAETSGGYFTNQKQVITAKDAMDAKDAKESQKRGWVPKSNSLEPEPAGIAFSHREVFFAWFTFASLASLAVMSFGIEA
jgi:hypothetical protein